MPQSGVGSMQGSNKDFLPMKGHRQGGTHPQCNSTNGHIYFHRGGERTHNVTQRTDTQFIFGHTHDEQMKQTNGQSHILR